MTEPSILHIEELRNTFTRPWAKRMAWVADASGVKHYSLSGELASIGPSRAASRCAQPHGGRTVQQGPAALGKAHQYLCLHPCRVQSLRELLTPASMVVMADGVMHSVVEVEEGQGQPLGMHLRIAGILQKAWDLPAPLRAELLRRVLETRAGWAGPATQASGWRQVGWPRARSETSR